MKSARLRPVYIEGPFKFNRFSFSSSYPALRAFTRCLRPCCC